MGSLIVLVLCFFCTTLIDQQKNYQKIITGKDALYLHNQIKNIQANIGLTEANILYPSNQSVPVNLKSTLTKYDWVELVHHFYQDASFNNDIKKVSNHYDFCRFTKEGKMYSFRSFYDPRAGANISYKIQQSSAVPHQIVVENDDYFFKSIDEEDNEIYHHIISYHNGILIYDITASGSKHDLDSPRRFRQVLMAIPKVFSYSLE
jgi:hypothetical protein